MPDTGGRKALGSHDPDAMYRFWSAALARFEKYIASDERSDLPAADQSNPAKSSKNNER
jgi:hypothetical protein